MAEEEDAVHVGAHNPDFLVLPQRFHGLGDAQLLHIEGDATPGRHAVEVHDLLAGGPDEAAVFHEPAMLQAVAGVHLVAAADLLPAVLRRGVPDPDHGEDALLLKGLHLALAFEGEPLGDGVQGLEVGRQHRAGDVADCS